MEPETQIETTAMQPERIDNIALTPTWKNLMKFALPTILSTIIMSTFGVVDGIFVSRLIDPIALAATSVVFPFLGFSLAIGLMLGVGGNALIAKKLGEGREVESRQNFSLITVVGLVVSAVISLVGLTFPDLIMDILGVDDFIRPMGLDYLRPLLWFLPVFVLSMMFQQFLITVGKAHYSAVTALVGGVSSAVLNYVFIRVLDMGIFGAALATSIGFSLPAIVGIVYFTFARGGSLYFVMPRFDIRALGRTSINGASEMLAMLATSITAAIMNNVLLDLGGAESQAAAAVMFTGMGVFTALFIGYASGVAPMISYNYGKGDTSNLKKAYKNSMWLIALLSIASVLLALPSTNLLIGIFDIPVGSNMYDMAAVAFRFTIASFIFVGFNSFGSMFFTALNNGVVSSIIALLRTLVFVVIAFMTLPALFGLTGAWMAFPAAEILAIFATVFFFVKMRKKYNYA
ncbi:MAG: MATE family efflux transporter [Defluviitaleaceae bacterium]|nr:MATE family efflux transporter [Defluviitaleaceae bacterium]